MVKQYMWLQHDIPEHFKFNINSSIGVQTCPCLSGSAVGYYRRDNMNVSHLPPIGGLKNWPFKPKLHHFSFKKNPTDLYLLFCGIDKRSWYHGSSIQTYILQAHYASLFVSLVGCQRSNSQWPQVKENKRIHEISICYAARLKWLYFKSSFGLIAFSVESDFFPCLA